MRKIGWLVGISLISFIPNAFAQQDVNITVSVNEIMSLNFDKNSLNFSFDNISRITNGIPNDEAHTINLSVDANTNWKVRVSGITDYIEGKLPGNQFPMSLIGFKIESTSANASNVAYNSSGIDFSTVQGLKASMNDFEIIVPAFGQSNFGDAMMNLFQLKFECGTPALNDGQSVFTRRIASDNYVANPLTFTLEAVD